MEACRKEVPATTPNSRGEVLMKKSILTFTMVFAALTLPPLIDTASVFEILAVVLVSAAAYGYYYIHHKHAGPAVDFKD